METELKLSLSAPDLPRLLAHPLLTQASDTQRLHNTYFDTPDLALQERRMAVRERLAAADRQDRRPKPKRLVTQARVGRPDHAGRIAVRHPGG